VRQQVELGLLGDPVRLPHRVDELHRPGSEPRRVGDAFAALVPLPASTVHGLRIERSSSANERLGAE
jgi:hypothetical protein